MEIKVYQVVHKYFSYDGICADYVDRFEVIQMFASRHDAEMFVAEFQCDDYGELVIEECNIIQEQENDEWLKNIDTSEFWWLANENDVREGCA